MRLDSVFRLFLKSACPLCQRPTSTEFCLYCQRKLDQQRFANSSQFWHESPHVFTWGSYGGALKRAIAQLKYEHRSDLAVPLGRQVAQAWLTSPIRREIQPIIVPIPLHPERQRQRGYNQAELLAREFCNLTGCRLQAHALQRTQATEALFKLSATDREQTLNGAFELGKAFQRPAQSTPILLFDDIYTSGATVRSAMQTFRRYEIGVRGVIVLAKAMPSKIDKHQCRH
ncbi:MAG: ComF family protein [Myxacorys californica WJT36-NPBG1]|jgi:ComF family protein|nr:ComF family protein [Myxacorys californica WJT36-NPBG1]